MSIVELRRQLEDGDNMLSWGSHPLTSDIAKWIAFREGNRSTLKNLFPGGWRGDRPYKHDPLANRLSNAFADFLYGEDPIIKPAEPDDTDVLDALIEANELTTELHQAVKTFSSEGEVWWRIYTDPEQSDHPLVEWHSRSTVFPFWRGRTFTAVAFVYEINRTADEVWRYVQYHEKERVQNILYQTSAWTGDVNKDDEDAEPNLFMLQKLGDRVSLDSQPYTAGLEDEWEHGLPMLAGRLINNVPRSRKVGKSDYKGVEDLLFDLDEAHTVDAENFKLAGKKRAIMPRKYQNQAGDAYSSEEIFWVDEGMDEMEAEVGPFKILEYDYNADSSIKRKSDLETTIVTRVGLVKQMVNADTSEGWAQSGTALKARLIPNTLSAQGKAREFDQRTPQIIGLMQEVDAMDEGRGGFGRKWKDASANPAVTRKSVMPEDPSEAATRHQTLITAELESIEHAVEELHPDWTPEQQELEIKRILANRNGSALDKDGNIIATAKKDPPPLPPGVKVVPNQDGEVDPGSQEEPGAPVVGGPNSNQDGDK